MRRTCHRCSWRGVIHSLPRLQRITVRLEPHSRHSKACVPEEGMWLDPFTVRNLEILHPNHPDGTSALWKSSTAHAHQWVGRALRQGFGRTADRPNRTIHMAPCRQWIGSTEELSLEARASAQILKSVGDLGAPDLQGELWAHSIPANWDTCRRGLHCGARNRRLATAGEDALVAIFGASLHPCGALLGSTCNENLWKTPRRAIGKGEVIAEGRRCRRWTRSDAIWPSTAKKRLTPFSDREAEATGHQLG